MSINFSHRISLRGVLALKTPLRAMAFLLALGAATNVAGQAITTYQFSTSVGNALDPMTGATTILTTGNDDSPCPLQNIGFTFNYGGVNYTEYSLTPDGFVKLGSPATTADFSNAFADLTNVPKIMPWWDDVATGTTGNVLALVTGAAPNRILKLQWFVTIPRNTGGPANSTFQLWLYETSNVIEIRYGTMNPGAGSASIGLRDAAAVNPITFQSVTASTNTVSIVTANNANSAATAGLVSGRMYRFAPPACDVPTFTGGNTFCGPGVVTAVPTNGVAPITFAWSDGTTTNANTISTSGAYTVTTTDALGCTASATINVTINPAVNRTAVVTDLSCGGPGNDGAIDQTVSGGNTLTYVWSDGANTEDRAGLTPGNYSVTITNDFGCTATASYTVFDALTISSSSVSASCFGYSDGSINVTVTSGTAPFTFVWSNGESTEDVSNLVAGTYTVTVSDGAGCSITSNIVVGEPAQIPATATATPNTGCGNQNIQLLAGPGAGNYNGVAVPYNRIPNPGVGTTQVPLTDDSQSAALNIGFPFSFYGTTYTQFYIYSNGYISFTPGQPTTVYNGQTLPNAVTPNNLIALGWEDLNPGGNGALIQYWIDGVAPNRRLVVDFNNVPQFGGAVGINVQAHLFENGNAIELHTTSIATAGAPLNLGTQGIENQNGTLGVGVPGRNGVVLFTAGTDGYRFFMPYTYAWDNAGFLDNASAINPIASNLPGGTTTFTVTVTDVTGCTNTATTSVSLSPAINISIPGGPANTYCDGAIIQPVVTGGIAPFTYLWSNGETTDAILTFAQGPITVTVTDALGCSTSASQIVTIVPTPVVNVTASPNPPYCGGDVVTLSAGAGGAPAVYTQTFTAGAAAPAQCTAWDAFRATLTGQYGAMTFSSNLNAGLTLTDPATVQGIANALRTGTAGTFTFGGNTYLVSLSCGPVGAVELSVNNGGACQCGNSYSLRPCIGNANWGGVNGATCNGATQTITLSFAPANTYLWSTGETTSTITVNATGTYDVTVTASGACSASGSIAITQFPSISASAVATALICGGNGQDGTVDLTATGGTGTLLYAWSNGATTEDISGLVPGVYTVTVSDDNGCTATASATVLDALSYSSNITNATCFGEVNGSIDLTILTGTAPFTFSWSTGANTEDVNGLGAGSYTVTVSDAVGCVLTATLTVTSPPDINAQAFATPAFVCGQGNVNLEALPYAPDPNNPNYTVAAIPHAMVAGTGTNVSLGDDQVSAAQPIGFPFTFYGTTYTQFYIGSNGFISFSPAQPSGCCSGQLLPNAGTPNNLVALSWEDLNGQNVAGRYQYWVDGVAPNRRLIVWYNDVPQFGGGQGIQGQIQLYENGIIEVHTVSCGALNTATQGIENANGTLGVAVPGRNAANWSVGTPDAYRFSPGSLYSYFWLPTDFLNDPSSRTPTAVGINLTTTYGVLVTDPATGCSDIATVDVIVNPAISIAINEGNANFCQGGALTTTVTGGAPAFSYLWSNGETTDAIAVFTSGTYSVTVTDNIGCTNSATSNVTIYQIPVVNVTADPLPPYCGNVTVTLTANDGGGTGLIDQEQANPGVCMATFNQLGLAQSFVAVAPVLGGAGVFLNSGTAGDVTVELWNNLPNAGGVMLATGTVAGVVGGQWADVSWPSTSVTPGLTYYLVFTSTNGAQCVAGTASNTYANGQVFANNFGAFPNFDYTFHTFAAPNTYLWTNGETTQSITANVAGTYEVTVTAGGVCTATASLFINVNQFPGIAVSIPEGAAVDFCEGGILTTAVTGGAPNPTYAWSNGETTDAIIVFASGTYSVTVTDVNGCTTSASSDVTIYNTPVINVVADPVGPYCGPTTVTLTASNVGPGGNGGDIVSPFVGGNGQDGNMFDVTAINSVYITSFDAHTDGVGTSGVYEIYYKVGTHVGFETNAGAWTLLGSVPFTSNGNNQFTPIPIAVNLTIPAGQTYGFYLTTTAAAPNNVYHNGTGVGNTVVANADMIVKEGMGMPYPFAFGFTPRVWEGRINFGAPLNYLWNTGETTNAITTNVTGTYDVTVTAGGVCTATATTSITINPALTASAVATNLSCGGNGQDGMVDLTTGGGTAPFTYAWSNGSTDEDLAGLFAGTYDVTVTDAAGCTASATATVLQALTYTVATTDATCFGYSNGTVDVTITSGTAPYTYVWSNGSVDEDLTAVAAGTYTVTITDGLGCIATASGTVGEPVQIPATAIATPGFGCGPTDIQLEAGPYAPAGYVVNPVANAFVACGGNAGPVGDDAVMAPTNIGFNFNWYGVDYTQFTISTNGNIQLGAGPYSAAFGNNAMPSGTFASPTIALAWDDLNADPGDITYGTFGTAPNRTLVVCFNNLSHLGGVGSGNITQGQIILHETTGVVDIFLETSNNFLSATQGFQNNAATGQQLNFGNWGANGGWNITPAGVYTYAWDPAGSLTNATIYNPQALGLATTTTFTVTVTDAGGCFNTASVTVNANPAVTATISGGPEFCQSGVISAVGGGGNGVFSYLWNDGSTTSDLTVTASGIYNVTITDGNGCSASATSTITILVTPVLNLTASPDAPYCPGQNVTIASNATGGGNNGTGAFYIRANVGQPWGSNNNITAMDAVFGAGNWTASTFETANAVAVFSASTRFVFLEGSDGSAQEMNTFFTANQGLIEGWVNAGGRLFMNAGPNEGGNMNWGFGGVTLNYGGPTFSGAVTAALPGHPIFAGPFTPVATTYTGGSFGHATVSGPGLTSLLDGDAPGSVVSFKAWGSGNVFFGGMTMPQFHAPAPQAQNFRQNIISYVNNLVGGAPLTYVWDNGATTADITVNASGTYCVTASAGLCASASACYTIDLSDVTPPVIAVPQCNGNFAITIAGGGFQDELSWTFRDAANVVIASGGPYGLGATTTTNVVGNNGPFTFFLETQGTFNDNAVSYTITCSGNPVVSGNLAGGQTVTQANLCCGAAQPGCPAAITMDNDPGLCGAVVTWTAPLATDNCGTPTLVASPTSGSLFPVGVTTVTYTATDDAGNITTCAFDVTVNDIQVPTITCPGTQVYVGGSLLLPDYTGLATIVDNCVPTVTQSPAIGTSILTSGIYTITLTATDAGGNTASCSFDLDATIIYCGAANRIFVDDNPPMNGNNGLDWDNAFYRLEDALAVATAGDEIWVKEGTYWPSAVNDRNAYYDLKSDVSLYGSFPQNADCNTLITARNHDLHPSILSGDIGASGVWTDNSYRVIRATNVGANVTVDGFTIMDGYTNTASNGGGVTITANAGTSSPVFIDCSFDHNYATSRGGGVHVLSTTNGVANPSFTDCDFTNNECNGDGAGFASTSQSGGTITVNFDACTFSGNNAVGNVSKGGATGNWATTGGASNFNYAQCSFLGNGATMNGGGIWHYGVGGGSMSVNVDGCTFDDNSASSGAAIYSHTKTGTMTTSVTGSTFTGNTSTLYGAVTAYSEKSSTANDVIITGCTFTNNVGKGAGFAQVNLTGSSALANIDKTRFEGGSGIGGGVFVYGSGANSIGTVNLTNNVFYGNSSPSSGGAISTNVISNAVATVNVNSCSFNGNSANANGSAENNTIATGGTCTINNVNSIFWGNTNVALSGRSFHNTGATASTSVDYCDLQMPVCNDNRTGTGVFTCTNTISADPMFVGGGDLHLMAGSPAIDACPNGPADDYDGNGRPFNGMWDMGAFEYGAILPRLAPAAQVQATNTNALGMELFPNPTQGRFTVLLDRAVTGTIEVTDMQGRVLQSAQLENANQVEMSLSGNAAGYYIVRLVSGKETLVRKVSLQ